MEQGTPGATGTSSSGWLARYLQAATGLPSTSVGGQWDWFDNLVEGLGGGLDAFYTDLDATSMGSDRTLMGQVAVIVQSEFGRRFLPDASQSTDHGYGNVLFSLGNKGPRTGPACHHLTGAAELMIAGGAESMSRSPFVVSKPMCIFGRDAASLDSTSGWRFVNPRMEQVCGIDGMPQTAEKLVAEHGLTPRAKVLGIATAMSSRAS